MMIFHSTKSRFGTGHHSTNLSKNHYFHNVLYLQLCVNSTVQKLTDLTLRRFGTLLQEGLYLEPCCCPSMAAAPIQSQCLLLQCTCEYHNAASGHLLMLQSYIIKTNSPMACVLGWARGHQTAKPAEKLTEGED